MLSVDGVYDVAVNVPGCVSGLHIRDARHRMLENPASYGILYAEYEVLRIVLFGRMESKASRPTTVESIGAEAN